MKQNFEGDGGNAITIKNIVFSEKNETWRLRNIELYNIPEYDIYYNEGMITQNDGIVMYIRSKLKHTVNIIDVDEIKCIQAEIGQNNGKNTNILAIYRSPSTCVRRFMVSLDCTLERLRQGRTKDYIIMGDINIDLRNKNQITEEYLNIMCEKGYTSLNYEPTREMGNTLTCIDHYFIRTEQDTSNSQIYILKTYITDHYPVILAIRSRKWKEEKEVEETVKMDYNKMRTLAAEEDWKLIEDCGSELECDGRSEQNDLGIVEKLACKFVDKIKKVIENSKFIVGKNSTKKKSWITIGLINSIKKRD
ncbi:hypothetical protein QAD02_002473 [Eretmocerus hayati]|uniref:Uncharacterized protein n=1 Tax=Eretmocerus hayati TaxID=131215 RepID=A0ACC2NIZ4_9HYME|nr:hypothetical protein QAD02_002473 [Eretmocerus hayati]